MKKIVLILCLVFIVIISNISFADIIDPNSIRQTEPETVEVVLNCSRAIRYNGTFQIFTNAKGNNVYPISYNGSTYLPIRAISSLFQKGITWDGATSSIYLGKGDVDSESCRDSTVRFYVPVERVNAIINKSIKIYFDNKIQTFKDANGKVVYPISYQGTTYLPVRAISNLFGAKIEYESALDIVDISK